MDRRQVLVVSLVVLLSTCTARATQGKQQPPIAEDARSPSEGTTAPIIEDVAFWGLRRIAADTLRMHVSSRTGERLDQARVESDVRTLARLGWFEIVRVETAGVTDAIAGAGSPLRVRLSFYLEEHSFLTSVKYTGSGLLARRQIEKVLADSKLTPKLGEPENPVALHQTAGAIQAALAELGHPDAHVKIERDDRPDQTVRVRFEITDGPYRPVGRVVFAGHPEVSGKVLRRQMRGLTPGAFFAGLRGKDFYTREASEQDRERILGYYQNHGYPEARIGAARVSPYEQTSRRWLPWPRKTINTRLQVTMPVEAGPYYRIESVEASEPLAQMAVSRHKPPVLIFDGGPDRACSARAVENLRRAWQARVQAKPGRNEVAALPTVEAIPALDARSHTVRVRLDLSSSPPYMVHKLEFLGNHRFPDQYFRKRVPLKEGAPVDDRALEVGLARLARTGYFKPIKKGDVRVETNEVTRTADVTIRVEELGQQRALLVGGRGQFGSTLGIVYTVFNLLDREELLSSHLEGGPETLELALSFAKEGFLGSRGALALSVFNAFLRPRLTGGVEGPFLRQQSRGVSAVWSYALTNVQTVNINYDMSHSKTEYSPAIPAGITGLSVSAMRTETSSHPAGFGWTRDSGTQRIVLADSVSGGWLGGSENLVRSKLEYGRIFHDPIFDRPNAWAFRTNFTAAGSYSGDMPVYSRLFPGGEFVRGLRTGELGPQAVVSGVSSSGTTRYSASPAGANLLGAANAEYRVPLAAGTEAAGFFDLGSGLLLPNWLGRARPLLLDSTNGVLHGSAGVELRWPVPGIGVPLRAYYALNVLRLDRSLLMPDGSLFRVHNRFSAFGWALGSLF